MKEIRDIKIDLLTGNKNPIVELFNEITKDTMIIKCDVYHKHGSEFIYHNGGEWIFYQDCQNGEFWCNYTRYWSLFESNLKLEYGEIQAITKYLVEEALKREVSTPAGVSKFFGFEVEEALKREVDTPGGVTYTNTSRVEEALKREVSTPVSHFTAPCSKVEEALKKEVSTPKSHLHNSATVVEKALKREVGSVEFVVFTPPPVEEALKREIGTPESSIGVYVSKVEEALKREIGTPHEEYFLLKIKVEEALKREIKQTE
jgi:hypothetical protein